MLPDKCEKNAATKFILAAMLVFASLSSHGAFGQTQKADAGRARDLLQNGAGSKNPDERVQAIVAAGMIGRNEIVVRKLDELLQDKVVDVRLAAVHTLADLKATQSEPALEKALRDDTVPEVAFAAAKALYAFGAPSGRKALQEVFDKQVSPKSGVIRTEERSFFGHFQTFRSATVFLFNQGIGYVPLPGVGAGFSALEELLSDSGLSPRAEVVLLLGRAKDQATADLLTGSLNDSDWSVRAAAAQVIAQTARVNMRDALVPLFDDGNDKVRFRAAGAYLHLYLASKNTLAGQARK